MPGLLRARMAVVGHVEWADMLVVDRVPRPGEIRDAREFSAVAAGSGSVAAVQMAKLTGGATFFTALAEDGPGRASGAQLRAEGVVVYEGVRPPPQRRGFVHLDRHVPAGIPPREGVQRVSPLAPPLRRCRPRHAQPELQRLARRRWRHCQDGLRRGVHDARGDAADEEALEEPRSVGADRDDFGIHARGGEHDTLHGFARLHACLDRRALGHVRAQLVAQAIEERAHFIDHVVFGLVAQEPVGEHGQDHVHEAQRTAVREHRERELCGAHAGRPEVHAHHDLPR